MAEGYMVDVKFPNAFEGKGYVPLMNAFEIMGCSCGEGIESKMHFSSISGYAKYVPIPATYQSIPVTSERLV